MIVGTIEWFDQRNDAKIMTFEKHLREERAAWREKTRVDMIAGDAILSARIVGVEKTMNSIDKNVRVLLRIELKKAAKAASTAKIPETLYTKLQSIKGDKAL